VSTEVVPPPTSSISPATSSRSRTTRTVVVFTLTAVLAASLPFWAFVDDYSIGVLLQIGIYAGYGLSWHLLAGYTGQYSFGHATFFGSGAYVMSILSYRADVSPWIGMLLGAAGAAVVGLVVGLIALRLSGLFFGLVTFGTSLMLGVAATHFVDLTGGAAGLSLPLRVDEPTMMQFSSQIPLFELSLVVVVAYLAFTWWILRTRLGLLFRSVRDDDVAAEASGINTRGVRLVGLCISAAMAGLVGALYAQSLLFIDPESGFGLTQSVNAIFTAIIGGMGTLLGPVLGAVAFILLRELGIVVSDGNGTYSVLFYSCVVFVVILAAPKGLAGIGRALVGRWTARRGKRAAR
jgi:branched-chain amino acid transport system permease protein